MSVVSRYEMMRRKASAESSLSWSHRMSVNVRSSNTTSLPRARYVVALYKSLRVCQVILLTCFNHFDGVDGMSRISVG